MDPEEITRQTLAAWDEEQTSTPEGEPKTTQEGDQPEQPTPEQTPIEEAATTQEQEPEEESSAEDVEQEAGDDKAEEDEGGAEEEGDEPQDDEVSAYVSDDPRVQAFLAKYQGDLEKALTGAVQLQQVLGRQGQEKAVLTRQVAEMQAELEQLRAQTTPTLLNAEQRQWVEEAIGSDTPATYVQHAVAANEFALARAICDQWAEESPYEAARAHAAVDAAEWRASQRPVEPEEPVTYDRDVLSQVLTENFPDMPAYQEKMVELLGTLGDDHPTVQDAKSNDPERAAYAIVNLYEIARASSASVSKTREQLQRDGRKKADAARAAAVVSSAQANPSPGETPRSKQIMPGLTLEALDEAW